MLSVNLCPFILQSNPRGVSSCSGLSPVLLHSKLLLAYPFLISICKPKHLQRRASGSVRWLYLRGAVGGAKVGWKERIFAWRLVNPWTHRVLVSMWMARKRGIGYMISSTWNSFSCCCPFEHDEQLKKLRQFIFGQAPIHDLPFSSYCGKWVTLSRSSPLASLAHI